MSTTRQTAAQYAALLRVLVNDEHTRLATRHGDENAPMGGWRNRAVESIAAREGMNPYHLDHILRGITPR